MEKKGMGIRVKILVIATIGPLILALVLSVLRIKDIRAGAVDAVVEKSRAVVHLAEAVRENMSHKLELGVIKPFSEVDPANIMEVVPIVTALNTAKVKAGELNYTFRAPKFSPRNPENTPSEFEGKVLKELEAKNLEEKVIVDNMNVYYFKPIKLTKECLFCHGDPAGEKDVVGGVKEGWREGEIHGAFEIISSLKEAEAKVSMAKISVTGFTIAILGVILVFAWMMIQKSVITPLQQFEKIIKAVASGDMTREVQVKSDDEFGVMAHALDSMRNELKNIFSTVKSRALSLKDAGKNLGVVSKKMTDSASETLGKSNSVAVAAEEMSVSMSTVAAAVEETSTNVSIIASAADQMITTINEIASRSEVANKSTKEAVEKSKTASDRVGELGKAASEIGKVTEAITEISEQTNLLALNATIEAARAGEAGKGFAVVANEIKELARQTAHATYEIKQKIEGIQASTKATISQIGEISDSVSHVNDIVGEIFTAIDEQAHTTREIAGNVGQASIGIREVSSNVSETSIVSIEVAKDIAQVSRLSDEMAKNSLTVKDSSGNLNNMAEEFSKMMDRFKTS
ncbi:MAG: methyl-accepting chemotaxis protein [Desulfobacteraceae bacterium]|jgi:methyl-accepting chemotaxis protein